MQGLLRGSGPKLKLVTTTAAAVAKVATERHVYRKRAITTAAPRPGLVQWTTSVPLRPRPARGLEPKQAQDLLHRDLCANSVEVHARHGCSPPVGSSNLAGPQNGSAFPRPFRSLSLYAERERSHIAPVFATVECALSSARSELLKPDRYPDRNPGCDLGVLTVLTWPSTL
jgi:hypothetical protein